MNAGYRREANWCFHQPTSVKESQKRPTTCCSYRNVWPQVPKLPPLYCHLLFPWSWQFQFHLKDVWIMLFSSHLGNYTAILFFGGVLSFFFQGPKHAPRSWGCVSVHEVKVLLSDPGAGELCEEELCEEELCEEELCEEELWEAASSLSSCASAQALAHLAMPTPGPIPSVSAPQAQTRLPGTTSPISTNLHGHRWLLAALAILTGPDPNPDLQTGFPWVTLDLPYCYGPDRRACKRYGPSAGPGCCHWVCSALLPQVLWDSSHGNDISPHSSEFLAAACSTNQAFMPEERVIAGASQHLEDSSVVQSSCKAAKDLCSS